MSWPWPWPWPDLEWDLEWDLELDNFWKKGCKDCKSFIDIASLFCIFNNNSIKWMESTQRQLWVKQNWTLHRPRDSECGREEARGEVEHPGQVPHLQTGQTQALRHSQRWAQCEKLYLCMFCRLAPDMRLLLPWGERILFWSLSTQFWCNSRTLQKREASPRSRSEWQMNELSLMQTENQEKDGPIRRNISSYTFFNIFADFLWVTIKDQIVDPRYFFWSYFK